MVAPVEDPSRTIPELAKVCASVQVCARFVSAMVPVLAGRLAVTVPSAPVTGCSVTVPDVALPIVTEPGVPDAPKVSAPICTLAFALDEQPLDPLLTMIWYCSPPEIVQPVPPLAAAHCGSAPAPCVVSAYP